MSRIEAGIQEFLQEMGAKTARAAPTYTEVYEGVAKTLRERGVVKGRPSLRDFQRAIDALWEAGLIERVRDPEDRRCVRIVSRERAKPVARTDSLHLHLRNLFDFIIRRLAIDLATASGAASPDKAESFIRNTVEIWYLHNIVVAARACQRAGVRAEEAIARLVEEWPRHGGLLDPKNALDDVRAVTSVARTIKGRIASGELARGEAPSMYFPEERKRTRAVESAN